VATAATAGILAATALFVGRQLRDARRTRHAGLLVELSRRWDDAAFLESQKLAADYPTAALLDLIELLYGDQVSSDDQLEELASKRAADLQKLEAIPNFWETIGVLHAERAISTSVVERMWGAALLAEWATWKEPIERLRELRGTDSAYIYFQEIADAVEAFEREQRLRRRLAARLRARQRGPGKALKTDVHARILLHRRKKG